MMICARKHTPRIFGYVWTIPLAHIRTLELGTAQQDHHPVPPKCPLFRVLNTTPGPVEGDVWVYFESHLKVLHS